jgi:hypothetical protein
MNMSPHLSQEQFARCFVSIETRKELHHVAGCSECRDELEAFEKTVSALRLALRGHVDVSAAVSPSKLPLPAATPRFGWAVVAALVVLLGTIPLLTELPANPPEVPVASSPDALMNAVNLHLSRTLPSPMEPVIALLPGGEPQFVIGELQ